MVMKTRRVECSAKKKKEKRWHGEPIDLIIDTESILRFLLDRQEKVHLPSEKNKNPQTCRDIFFLSI